MKAFIRMLSLLLFAIQGFAFSPGVEKYENIPADTFPTPKGIRNMLFYVQRTPNANTVIYELNVNEKNQLDKDDPVNIFWIRYAHHKERADLSYIQRVYAYGLKTKEIGNNTYELRFVAYKKLPFYLIRSPDQQYHVYATIKKNGWSLRAFLFR